MTFNQISIKIFRGSKRRYINYFLCNTFTIMMFFMYSTLMFNKELSNSKLLDKSVSSAIIIPSVALIAFTLIFISFAHGSFMKARKKEFGLFMILGMSVRQIRKLILLENIIIAGASLLFGLLTGTLFSRLFFLLMMKILEVKGINFAIGYRNYIATLVIFLIVFVFSLLVTVIIISSYEEANLLKSDRAPLKRRKSNLILTLIGPAILVVTTLALMVILKKDATAGKKLVLECTAVYMIGLYLTISSIGEIIISLAKRRRSIYLKRLLYLTSLDYKFKQNKGIIFIIALMIGITVFYTSNCLRVYIQAEKDAVAREPYDIALIQSKNFNNILDDRLKELINKNNNTLINEYNIEVLRFELPIENTVYTKEDSEQFKNRKYNSAFNEFIISEKDINKLTKDKISVNKGEFINLILSNYLSEEEKNNFDKKDIYFKKGNVDKYFTFQGNIFELMFNNTKYISGNFVILSNEDYNRFKGNNPYITYCNLKLLNFSDWKNTNSLADDIDEENYQYNKSHYTPTKGKLDNNDFYKVSSKARIYAANKQGGALIFFLLSFNGIFFFIATSVLLYLRIYSEIDYDMKKYNKLFRIGMTEKEFRKNIGKELRVFFYVAPIIGVLISFIYTASLYISDSSGDIRTALICNGAIGGVYLVFQIIYYLIAVRMYSNKLVS